MSGYCAEEIINKLTKHGINEKLYQQKMINYSGVTKDTKESYSEIIAGWLLSHDISGNMQKIMPIIRKSYKVGHSGVTERITIRNEEILAKALFRWGSLEHLGRVAEYQIPLKSSSVDKAVGKIDLVSSLDKKGLVYLIELKAGRNTETLLRSVLEIATYYQQLNRAQMLKDYKLDNARIRKAVLLGINTRAYQEAVNVKQGSNLARLIGLLAVELYSIEEPVVRKISCE